MPHLPYLSSALALLSFVVSMALLASASRGKPRERPDASALAPRRFSGLDMAEGLQVFLLMGVVLFWGLQPIQDALLVLFAVWMLVFSGLTRRAAAFAPLDRDRVAERGVLPLIGAALCVIQLADQIQLDTGGSSWIVVSVLTLCGAGAIALKLRTGGKARGWRVVLVLGWLVGVILFFGPRWTYRVTPEDLSQQLQRAELDVRDLARWTEAAALYGALDAVGEATPELEALASSVRKATSDPEGVHPAVWLAAHRMRLLREDDWGQLASHSAERRRLETLRRQITRWLSGDSSRNGVSPIPYQNYGVILFLAVEEVSDAEADALAEMIVERWPETGDTSCLELASLLLDLLDLLGREDLIVELRPRAERLLVEHWLAPGMAIHANQAGGFTSQPPKYGISFKDCTLAGVELIVRYGSPRGVDLRRLRSYLHVESRPSLLPGVQYEYLSALPRAALLRIERQVEIPNPASGPRRLLDVRLLAGAVLLVVVVLTGQSRCPVLTSS